MTDDIRQAAFEEMAAFYDDEAHCVDYWAPGPPPVAEAIRDYAKAHPHGPATETKDE